MNISICSDETYETIYSGLRQYNSDKYFRAKELISQIIGLLPKENKPSDDAYAEVIRCLYAVNVEAVSHSYEKKIDKKISSKKLKDVSSLVAIVSPERFLNSLGNWQHQLGGCNRLNNSELYRLVDELTIALVWYMVYR